MAAGGMGELYLGTRDGVSGFRKPVAIKLLAPHLARNSDMVELFLEEARLVAQIHHPNVVVTEDLWESEGNYCIALEYVHGAALSSLVPRLSARQLRFSPEFAVAMIADAARGLHAAHEARDNNQELLNVVHQDVSPQNILLSDEGVVKLIDFGVARSRARMDKSQGKGVRGKLRYMSPEQLRMQGVDRRTDIFALGVVLWETLAGRRLHGRKTNAEVAESLCSPLPRVSEFVDVPKALDDVIASAISLDRNDRPPTARVFRKSLENAVPHAGHIDLVERAAVLMGIYGDELTIRRVQLSLIDQSALSPAEMISLPAQALARWTLPLTISSSIASLFPPPMAEDDQDEEVTDIQTDWLREPGDPVANK